MGALHVVCELTRRGVRVWVADALVKYEAPNAEVANEAVPTLRRYKSELLNLLAAPAAFTAAIAEGDDPEFAAVMVLRHWRREPGQVQCANCALLAPVGCLSRVSSVSNPWRELAIFEGARKMVPGDRFRHWCSGFFAREEKTALAQCWLDTLARRNGWEPAEPAAAPMTEDEARALARFLAFEAADETVVTRAEIMARAHLCQGLRGTLLQVANPVQSWLEELDERFEERAAILNHEAGLPPREAERRALREALQWARDRGCPANLLDRWQRGHQTRESA